MTPSLILFVSMALLTVAVPGPTTLLALNNGARFGIRAALPGIAGALLSDAVLIGAAAAGLGGILLASTLAFEVLRWLGVAYLVWLGAVMLRDASVRGSASFADKRQGDDVGGRLMRRCFMVAVTNPKAYLFFSALLPSFIDPQLALLPQYLLLTALFVAIDAVVLLLFAAAGSLGSRRYCGPLFMRRVQGASGLGLLLMAVALSLWRRDPA